jgi:hypothetical protein
MSTVTLSVQSAAGHHGGGQTDGATLAALLLVLLGGRLIWPSAPGRVQKNA